MLRAMSSVLAQISDREAGEVGGAQRGRLEHLRAHDGHAQDVRLELHEEIVGGGAAVDAKLGKRDSRITLHRVQDLRALERDAFQRGTRDVRARGCRA